MNMYIKVSHNTVRHVAVAGVLLLATFPQPLKAFVTETHKLELVAGGTYDSFGGSVAVYGNLAVVSSVPLWASGNDFGAVYVFDTATGTLMHTLTPSDPEADDLFGRSVDIYGNTIIIGAPEKSDVVSSGGAAYLFDAVTGTQTTRISTGNPTFLDGLGYFGSSVAIEGDTALIGQPEIGPDKSAAYLYDLSGSTPPTNILAGIQKGGEDIGAQVDLSGTTAAVGAYRIEVDGLGNHVGEGAVFLFDVSTGIQIGMLTADDRSDGDRFGASLAINDSFALVGASGNDDAGSWGGSAYLFDISTGTQLFQLAPEDGEPLNSFGGAVVLHDDYAFVSATSASDIGMVYMFDLTTGAQVHKFSGSDTQPGDHFGGSLAVYEDTLLVGASGVDGINIDSGAAYLFTIPEPGMSLIMLAAATGWIAGRKSPLL